MVLLLTEPLATFLLHISLLRLPPVPARHSGSLINGLLSNDVKLKRRNELLSSLLLSPLRMVSNLLVVISQVVVSWECPEMY